MRRNKMLTGFSATILTCILSALLIMVVIFQPYFTMNQGFEDSGQTVPSNTPTPDPSNPETTSIPDSETSEPEPTVTDTPPVNYDLVYELPINGAAGFALLSIGLKETHDENSRTLATINPGEAFRIISSQDNWWNVEHNGVTGWVDNTLCMINLPDIIPSIIYANKNSSTSAFRSSGYHLPNITNRQLYNAVTHNNRFEKEQYIVPILYRTAKKVYNAQQAALRNGDSLRIYETFRPLEVQRNISNSLQTLMSTNSTVHNGINTNGWRKGWFIAQSVSTHQMGVAIDVSLVRVTDYERRTTGGHSYKVITSYEEHTMPTRIHELSARAVVLTRGANWNRETGWGDIPFADTMTEGAKRLHNLFVNAGFVPLASEWWHFDDLEARDTIRGRGITGNFNLKNNSVSEEPNT